MGDAEFAALWEKRRAQALATLEPAPAPAG